MFGHGQEVEWQEPAYSSYSANDSSSLTLQEFGMCILLL